MMRNLGGDIDRPRHPLERVEKVRKALPIPFQPFGEHRAGDVFDALYQIDEGVAMIGPDGREAYAAIAEQNGRDTVPGGGCEDRVPGRLPVIMGLDIGPAGWGQTYVGCDI